MDFGVAFRLGSLEIRWYGVFIAIAVLSGYLVAHYRIKRRGGDVNELSNILLVVVISGIVGARLVYVLLNLRSFARDIPEIFAIWHGGISIHGALLGGLVSLYAYTRLRKLPFWWWADMLAPSVVLGQAIGRWGNYFNQELFGYPSRLPWAIYIQPEKRPLEYAGSGYFHPTFLYESLLNLAVFGALLWLAARQQKEPAKWPSGSVAITYVLLYSLVRFTVEIFRIEPRLSGPFSLAQLVSLGLAVAAAAALVALRRIAGRKKAG